MSTQEWDDPAPLYRPNWRDRARYADRRQQQPKLVAPECACDRQRDCHSGHTARAQHDAPPPLNLAEWPAHEIEDRR